VSADATAARLTGLAGGAADNFQVEALNEYGAGPTATTNTVTVPGSASPYVSTVLAAGPSVFYRLADTDPDAMADSSGHGATGWYAAAAALGQPGPLATDPATAMSSNSPVDPVAAGNPSLPVGASARTMEGWANSTSSSQQPLAGYGTDQTGNGFTVYIAGDQVVVSGYNDDLSFTAPAPLDDGSWHFIVATTTGTSATAYVDGTSLGTQTFPVALDTLPTSPGLQIGDAMPLCNCGVFDGSLADIAAFPTALTAAQVSAQFTASGNTAGPVVSPLPEHTVRDGGTLSRPPARPLP
jgi:hypothetical protein